MITIYGVVNKDSTHTDVSSSLLGAKQYATRNGYNKVSKRMGYNAQIISVKISSDRWVDYGSKRHKKWEKKNKD